MAASVEWPALNSPGGASAVGEFGQSLDLDRHQIGGVLGGIGIGRENDGDRLADIAHAAGGEDRLPVRIEAFDAGEAEIDRRNAGDIGRRPDRDDARRRARRAGIDRHDAAMRMRGAHHAHVQLMRERDVRGEAALAGDQRPILKTRHRTADKGHGAQASRWPVSLMRRTQIFPAPTSISLRQHGSCAMRQ